MRVRFFYILILPLFLTQTFIYPQEQHTQLNLMPEPANVSLTGARFNLDSTFTVEVKGNPAQRIYPAASRMLRRLSARTGSFFNQDYITRSTKVENPSMIISVERPGKVKLFEDESYALDVTSTGILLKANTDIGALRGIETFLQLLSADEKGYYFPGVIIKDQPRFPWRGLMIDVSRHFMPVDVIKRNLDGMAAVKMNVFHWHLSDDQGFRVECKTFPRLTGMGSDGLYYTQAQIKDIIKYADDRGIRVVPEFDLPGHSTSWFVGYPQYASAPGPYEIERQWGVFDPTFNPAIPGTYKFFDKFFKEMSMLFPDEYMHIGGDENSGKQWNDNPEIQAFMKRHKITDNHALQSYFNNHLLSILTKYHKRMIGWDEILHPGMPKNIVIQSWRGIKSLKEAVSKGYMVILSNGYYIDLNRSAVYHYSVDPDPDSLNLSEEQKKLVLGGETTMWSEFVSPENIDSRIWPRTAAIAERFWSPKNVTDVNNMYRRLDVVSLELENVGLMHIKNPQMMLRRLANGYDITALKNFVSVVEPVKGYDRLNQRTDYTSYAPLSRVVDAAVPDAEAARKFRNVVAEYLNGNNNSSSAVEYIKSKLALWKDNDTLLEKTINRSPVLKEIQPLSKELSNVASLGLKAMQYIVNGKTAEKEWTEGALKEVNNDKGPHGQVELMVLTPIEQLIKRAGDIK